MSYVRHLISVHPELDALMSIYLLRCSNKLFAALDTIYEDEERNESWATMLEEKIEKATRAAGPALTGACRSSLCRFDIDTTRPSDCNPRFAQFNRGLIDSVSGTKLQVSILYRPTRTGCNTRYFYSTVMPPAFLEPLRRRMGDGW